MLLLVFQVGCEYFGLDAASIVEVTVVTRCHPVPLAPKYFLGLCRYRGTVVPVLDLTALLAGTASRLLFSTRLVIARTAIGSASPRTLGLIAESAVQVIRYSPDAVTDPEIRIKEAPYLGKVVVANGCLIQILSLPSLLETEVGSALFDQALYGS